MKQEKKGTALAIGMALVMLMLLLGDQAVVLMALPFTFAGKGLRAMSLSGSGGNVAAIVLYGALCLLPLALKFGKKWGKWDIWLLVCSGLMFYVMYLMVNPGQRPAVMRNEVGDGIYASGVYSLLLTWAVGKLANQAGRTGYNLYRVLEVFLILWAAELALVGIGRAGVDCWTSIGEIKAANTMSGLNLAPTCLFQWLIFAGQAVEYGLDAWLLLRLAGLMRELGKDPYSEACAQAGLRLQKVANAVLLVPLMAQAALNGAQAMAAPILYHIDTNLNLPVTSIILALGSMALTRLLVHGKELKEDNDLFI